MTYPPGIMSSFVVCENYVSELCTLTYERTVPFSPMFTYFIYIPPSQVQFDNIMVPSAFFNILRFVKTIFSILIIESTVYRFRQFILTYFP